jgi:hypothetical protein
MHAPENELMQPIDNTLVASAKILVASAMILMPLASR